MNFSDINSLHETNSAKEANELLQKGWTLYDIEKKNGRYTFLLVRL
ncbi:hypothetical protein H7K32_11635 [Brevibacillus agri]|nr:hypothetical protein [Brevibacillus agri]MBY0052324.1 hypothetical protein [Brevibacillus agri]